MGSQPPGEEPRHQEGAADWSLPPQPGARGQPEWRAEGRTDVLRPLNVGDVLDRMFRLIVEHWRTYLLALGVIIVPVNFVVAFFEPDATADVGLLEVFQNPAQAPPPTPLDVGQLVGLSAAVIAVSILVTPLVTGVACAIAAAGHRGERPEPGPMLRHAGSRYLSLVATAFLSWFLPLMVFLPGAAAVGAAAATGSAALGVLGALLLLAGLAGAVALYVLFLFGIPVVIVERTGPVAALARSLRLVRRRFWPIFGIMLLAALIGGIVGSIVTIPLTFIAALFGGIAGALLTAVAGSVSGILSTPLTANAQTLLYYDTRVRTEGLDLQMMTERLAEGW